MTKPKRTKFTPKQFCYIFAHEGTCKFGEACRFHHDTKEFMGAETFDFFEMQRKAVNQQQTTAPSSPPPPFNTAYDTKTFEESSAVLFVHENGIVGVCLGDTHPVCSVQAIVSKITQVVNQGDFVQTNEIVCYFETPTHARIDFRSPVPGKLVQFNPKLASEPGLLLSDRENKGFLCLIKATEPYPLMFARYFTPRMYNK